MKYIPLHTHPKADPNQPEPVTTQTVVLGIINNIPDNGLTLDDITKRLRIKDAVDKIAPGSTVLVLEDADHTMLVNLIPTVRWRVVDEFVIQVTDAIKNADGKPS